MSYLIRSSSPCTRRIGGEPATMCKSEAPESNISLKKASSLAISHSLHRENRLRTSLSVRVLGSQVHTRYCHVYISCQKPVSRGHIQVASRLPATTSRWPIRAGPATLHRHA